MEQNISIVTVSDGEKTFNEKSSAEKSSTEKSTNEKSITEKTNISYETVLEPADEVVIIYSDDEDASQIVM